jgi:hypothetical protein
VSTVFKALTLAMGVAVVALSILEVEGVNMPLLQGLGLTCAGISLLKQVINEKNPKIRKYPPSAPGGCLKAAQMCPRLTKNAVARSPKAHFADESA